ncbi:hypothetical protein AB7C87_16135 [Natrarchaeobius sp. A-rgal3]|uniref:hypothetical protein n=1 Tax=Natrarchaeobius versutus TaxID=1679078 RepID=UPI00350FF6F8
MVWARGPLLECGNWLSGCSSSPSDRQLRFGYTRNDESATNAREKCFIRRFWQNDGDVLPGDRTEEKAEVDTDDARDSPASTDTVCCNDLPV